MTDVKLEHPGGQLSMPVRPAVEGPAGLEIGNLLKETGYVTYDPGFVNTAACTSAITYIDGDAGILRYRGYPIDQLAEKSSFLEVSLPADLRRAADRRRSWRSSATRIRRHTLLHEEMRRFFDGFPRDAHPMPVLSSAVSALSTFYQDSLDPFDRRPGGDLHGPAAGQGADDRVVRVQEVDRPAVAVPGQLARATSRTSCA